MKDIKVVVITHDGRSAEIGIEKGVGQGDGLSAILLNISLERLVSAISEKKPVQIELVLVVQEENKNKLKL